MDTKKTTSQTSQPDQTEKLLEDWCDVFADIIEKPAENPDRSQNARG